MKAINTYISESIYGNLNLGEDSIKADWVKRYNNQVYKDGKLQRRYNGSQPMASIMDNGNIRIKSIVITDENLLENGTFPSRFNYVSTINPALIIIDCPEFKSFPEFKSVSNKPVKIQAVDTFILGENDLTNVDLFRSAKVNNFYIKNIPNDSCVKSIFVFDHMASIDNLVFKLDDANERNQFILFIKKYSSDLGCFHNLKLTGKEAKNIEPNEFIRAFLAKENMSVSYTLDLSESPMEKLEPLGDLLSSTRMYLIVIPKNRIDTAEKAKSFIDGLDRNWVRSVSEIRIKDSHLSEDLVQVMRDHIKDRFTWTPELILM